mgnify:CR=1 FL=1
MLFRSQIELLITRGSKPFAKSLFPLVEKVEQGHQMMRPLAHFVPEVALKKERASKIFSVNR